VFSTGITLRLSNLDNVIARSPDEGVYTYQASVIAEKGTPGIRSLLREYNLDRTWWDYPHPLRVGYLWPLAAVMKITNNKDIQIGSYISCFFSIATLLLIIVVGLRFFNLWITLYALLFLSVSPMALAIARRTWQDAMIGFIGFLLVYLSCEITRDSRKIIWYIIFILAGSYYILVKTTCALIYFLCIAWILCVLFIKEKAYLKGLICIASIAIGSGITIIYLAYLAGGIPAIVEPVKNMLEAAKTSTYRIEYCTGKWYEFFELLWITAPLNTMLCFIGIGMTFLTAKSYKEIPACASCKNRGAVLGIVLFMIIFMTIILATQILSLNLRYISVLYAPFYLAGGLGFCHMLSFLKAKLKNSYFSNLIVVIAVAMIIVAIKDYQNFQKIIVRSGIKDLSIGLIRQSVSAKTVR